MQSSGFYLLCGLCLFAAVPQCSGTPVLEYTNADLHLTGGKNAASHHHREKRAAANAPTLADRTFCSPADTWPAIRVNTTQRLIDLRQQMQARSVDAFIVLSADAHGSEYPAESDKRRAFISGFKGSAGYAVVTMAKAALWTDGRYFLEAEDALDCNWIFMRSGISGVPSLTEWLISELNAGNTVGADPFLVTNGLWKSWSDALAEANISMAEVMPNPVDTIWTDRPNPLQSPINALEMRFAGKSWQDKIKELHQAMTEHNMIGAHVVSALDETAWLFNLRASDIAFNPFYISYAIVEYYGDNNANNRIRLYIHDHLTRLSADPTDAETKQKLHQHLNTGADGTCATGQSAMCVEVLAYDPPQVLETVRQIVSASPNNKVWVTPTTNYAIYNVIPQTQLVQDKSSIALAKSQKNLVEREGMQRCYNRDSAVLIEFLAMLEKEIKEGKQWTEVSAAERLKNMRKEAQFNRGRSFKSISGSGPNGAVIHYSPSLETNRKLTTDEMYLLDSGGQYLDCTTDVTRTMHYGTPSAYMIECYTRVLMGSIDLAQTVFPKGVKGNEIDVAARKPLWSVGLDYRHGTGHGIGAYLSVHEAPPRITYLGTPDPVSLILDAYMFVSDEPGFYEPGQFGIRLETIVMVDPINTTYKFGDMQFLRLKPIQLVPFEPDLIDYNLLDHRQIDWLNKYNELTQKTIEPLLTTDLAKAWMRERTKPYRRSTTSSASQLCFTLASFVMATLTTLAVLM